MGPGGFYGFLDTTADIKTFVLTDGYIALRQLTVAAPIPEPPAPIPEPPTFPVFAFGLGIVGLLTWGRRRKSLIRNPLRTSE
jgi:hypothetical protein